MSTQMSDPITHNRPTGWRHVPIARSPRRTGNGKFGGVVAGLSRAYGFDLRTTRIATIVAMVILPPVFLAYLAGWILLPCDPEPAQSLHDIVRDRRRMPLLAVLVLLGIAGLFGTFGSWFLFHGAPWGLALVALGVVLWLGRSTRPLPPPASPTTGAPTSGSPTTITPVTSSAAPIITPIATDLHRTSDVTDELPRTPTTEPFAFAPPTMHSDVQPGYATGTTPTNVTPVTSVTAVASPARRSWPITAWSLVVAAGGTALTSAGEAAGWWHPDWLWIVVGGLGVILLGMFVSMIVNRSWILPAPFTLVAILVVGLCVAHPRLVGGTGDRTTRPATGTAATVDQHLAAGQLTIDLTEVPAADLTNAITVHAEVGAGRLHVIVPDGVTVHVTTDIGMGSIALNGHEVASGVRQHDTRDLAEVSGPANTTVGGTGPILETGTITLDVRVGMGRLDVDRAN